MNSQDKDHTNNDNQGISVVTEDNGQKKVIIVSYFFYPENKPRAFRTYELVKEFSRRKYVVELVLPNKTYFHNLAEFADNPFVRFTFIGKPIETSVNIGEGKAASNYIKGIDFIKKTYLYINPFKKIIFFLLPLTRHFLKLKIRKDHKTNLISISFPTITHYSFVIAKIFNRSLNNINCTIAEYSDPFATLEFASMMPLYKYLDKKVFQTFDYIVIPDKIAIQAYSSLGNLSKIRVIPQGFNLDDNKLENYKENPVLSFAYAGTFYKTYRDPSYFFDYLSKLDKDYIFYIFAPSGNRSTEDVLQQYRDVMNGKLIITYDTNRSDLLPLLSKMDFLINFENGSKTQTPSKLIDYAITMRPILSLNNDSDYKSLFENFYNKNYTASTKIDLNDYDIKNIVNSFEALFNEE